MRQVLQSLQAIEGLEPQRLWRYFNELSCIPRESGNEEGVRQYLLAFAKEHGLESQVDAVGNVILYLKATKGLEHVPSVALQGHMDMVCVKDEGVVHDFLKDPLTLHREGDFLSAVGTTLGADNGIAIALILDLFSDPLATHGPLEAIFTVTEETGLVGAFGLDPTLIHSRRLLNLDSEEEGVFYIGCAGGNEADATLGVEWAMVPAGYSQWDLVVDGLLGGHSGSDVDKQHANSIACAMRFLHTLNEKSSIMLAALDGGTKRNVIPSVCKATFLIPAEHQELAIATAKAVEAELSFEYSVSDPGVRLTLSPRPLTYARASSLAQSRKLINAVYITPYGVHRVSKTIKDLVETSSNLAIARLQGNEFKIVTSHRSSVLSSRDNLAAITAAALQTSGASVKVGNGYPAWTPNPKSPLAKICAKAWEEHTGTTPKITAIHAGLECGIINSLVVGMDSISLGPNLWGVHSTDEKVSVSSTARVAAYLRHLLATIR
jgi:dipeptidase D